MKPVHGAVKDGVCEFGDRSRFFDGGKAPGLWNLKQLSGKIPSFPDRLHDADNLKPLRRFQ